MSLHLVPQCPDRNIAAPNLEFYRARYEAIKAEHAWRPIDAAPHDGTWIWAFIPFKSIPDGDRERRKKLPRHMAVQWVTDITERPGWTASDFAKTLHAKQGGYWSFGGKRKPLDGCPSHWRPLPENPE